jgi:hypothetical protein
VAQRNNFLDDRQMRDFIGNGYVMVCPDLPRSFHDDLLSRTNEVFDREGNPGNNLLPRIPEIRRVLEDPTVRGALMSLLGEDYYMQPHRHPHYNHPQSEGQKMHQDGGRRWSHRTRRLLVFYYPQDTPMEIGPTGIVPGSHYYCTKDGATLHDELAITGEAGMVTLANYDLWHRAMPNQTDRRRYMMKFLFARMSEPEAPSWDAAERHWPNPDRPMHGHLWHWHHGHTNSFPDGSIYGAGSSTDSLLSRLDDETETECLDAAYALAGNGDDVVPRLIEKLGGASDRIRRNTCIALSAIGAPAVSALTEALGHRDDAVRAAAAETLGDIGRDASSAVPALVEAARDEVASVRMFAVEALGIAGQTNADSANGIAPALSDENERVRRNAGLAMVRLGQRAAGSIDALGEALDNENRYVRADSAGALHRIGTAEARDVLMPFLMTARWCSITNRDTTH